MTNFSKSILLIGAILHCSLFSITNLTGQSSTLFDDAKVGSIYIFLPQDSLNFMLWNVVSKRYMHAKFVFEYESSRDTIEDVGLRLRGNTSLNAQKKSFKISFDAFAPSREYQGVRKLNLRGQANDPTMIREKLFYEVWEKMGMPKRRAAFCKLFINNEYRGLYTNIEELDKQWLDRAYGDKNGNLYKCTWPADLAWLGNDVNAYKNVWHDQSENERAYDLVTNESADDYSGFMAMMSALHQGYNATYIENLEQNLNVDAVLRAYAIDVATGNWDDYFYLKNNYYLYDNPISGRIEWFTYDTDNSFGIDWVNRDWGTRNCLDWHNHSEPRPLATKLLAIPAYKSTFIHYLDTLAQHIICPDIINPRIDFLHQLIIPAAAADTYRTLDFGYTMAEFHNSFNVSIDGHTPYGLKQFLAVRCSSIQEQIVGLVSLPEAISNLAPLKIYPNPAGDIITLEGAPLSPFATIGIEILTLQGIVKHALLGEVQTGKVEIPIQDLENGIYLLRVSDSKQVVIQKFIKI